MTHTTANADSHKPKRGGADLPSARSTPLDVLTYLRKVKTKVAPATYTAFIDVLRNFKGNRLSTTGVIRHVKRLFHGERDLILNFNAFLPKGYKVTLSEVADKADAQDQAGQGKESNTREAGGSAPACSTMSVCSPVQPATRRPGKELARLVARLSLQ